MAKRNIVLVHGWASDQSIWQETRKHLEPNHRVHTLNLPLSKHVHSYRDAVVNLIEQNALTQVVLVGWSLGALVAIQVAHQIRENVRGLALISSTAKFLSDIQSDISDSSDQGGISPVLLTRMKKRLSKNPEQTVDDFYKLMFSAHEQSQGLDQMIIKEYLNRGRVWELNEAQAGLDFLAAADLRAELRMIACPVLLLHGEQDEICPFAGAVYLQQELNCVQLVSFAGTGHIPFLTNAYDFHQALEGWVANL